MTKEIVVVHLAVNAATGTIEPAGPFVVVPSQLPHRGGGYDHEPDVIAQFWPGERQARFEAEWTNHEWKVGKRIADA